MSTLPNKSRRRYATVWIVARDEPVIERTTKMVVADRATALEEAARLNAQAPTGVIYSVYASRALGFETEDRKVWMGEDGRVVPHVRGFNCTARRLVGPWRKVGEA